MKRDSVNSNSSFSDRSGGLSPGEAVGLSPNGIVGLSPGGAVKISALPRFHQRAFAHNYRAPFIYHIILKKQPGFEDFGSVKGDARIAFGNPGCAGTQISRGVCVRMNGLAAAICASPQE